MRFDELDSNLRQYEVANDRTIPPGFFVVARLDGRGFTRLTKETLDLEAPYDERFRDAMIQTMMRLMDCGFRCVFAYAQSDEISLLFHPEDGTFDRKHRKWLSILAGEASAALSLAVNRHAVMDCRLSEMPSASTVVDYFSWRMEDASRNCLNSHCYWMLRKRGAGVDEATRSLCGLSTSAKHDMLFEAGVNFNDLPTWQKRGYAVRWSDYLKEGWNPVAGEQVMTVRRRLEVDMDLPQGEGLSEILTGLLEP